MPRAFKGLTLHSKGIAYNLGILRTVIHYGIKRSVGKQLTLGVPHNAGDRLTSAEVYRSATGTAALKWPTFIVVETIRWIRSTRAD